MKKLLLLSSVAGLLIFAAGCKKDKVEDTNGNSNTEEFLASTTVEKRTAVLEDFTGVRCGYCPAGHTIAKGIEEKHDDKFITIAVHSGGYAQAAPGWANFTNQFGDAIRVQAAPIGYPAGTINRILYEDLLQVSSTGAKSKMAISRGSWENAANRTMILDAPVNLGAKATFDPASGELTVKVDAYYTSTETVPNNLNVALLQDGLISKQSGGGENYTQNNVLRHMLTGKWGETLTTTAAGTSVSKTYTYTLPADYNGADAEGGGAVVVENLKVVAFVSQGQKDILNACEVEVK